MLGALAALCAMLALPAFASALPAHLDSAPANAFTVHGGVSELSRVGGGGTTGTTTTGKGSFENTTTGTVKLTFHHVTAANTFNCTTSGQATGTVTTTELPFHLVMLATNKPGILITPGANNHFATYNCGIFVGTIEVKGGNGILGTVKSPECGVSSTTATLDFNATGGVQEHLNYTGTEYTLKSSLNGSTPPAQSGMEAEATITFGGGESRSIVCTH